MRAFSALKQFSNHLLGCIGLRLRSEWELNWATTRTFQMNGREFSYFFHSFNCGWPPHRCTERVVELALADAWLTTVAPASVTEVGAVTPYYWPGRVDRVIDPADPHMQVNDRCSVFDCDLNGLNVLSISTLEHIGTEEYGLPKVGRAIDALLKIAVESANCLITFPVGYNEALDRDMVAMKELPPGTTLSRFDRLPSQEWRQRLYGNGPLLPYDQWANTLFVLEKGNLLSDSGNAGQPAQ